MNYLSDENHIAPDFLLTIYCPFFVRTCSQAVQHAKKKRPFGRSFELRNTRYARYG